MEKFKLIKWVDARRYMLNNKQTLFYIPNWTYIFLQGEINIYIHALKYSMINIKYQVTSCVSNKP